MKTKAETRESTPFTVVSPFLAGPPSGCNSYTLKGPGGEIVDSIITEVAQGLQIELTSSQLLAYVSGSAKPFTIEAKASAPASVAVLSDGFL